MTPSYTYHLIALLNLIAASQRHFGASAAPLRHPPQQERRAEAIDEADGPPDSIEPEGGSLIAMQFTADPYAGRDPLSLVLDGEFALVALRYAPNSFSDDGSDDYGANVYGEFCAYDPALDGADPAARPTVAAAAGASEHCGEHRRSLPLKVVVEAVNDRDASSSSTMSTLPVAGLLFHEGYAGAGLLASAVAAVGPARVVAEHPALRDALAACDVVRNRYHIEDCAAAKQQRLVVDIVALLARAPAGAVGGLHLKLPSASAAYLPELHALFPDAKWAFVYRGAEEALAKATGRGRATCVKARRNPSSALAVHATALLEGSGHADLEGPSHNEVCALHLASLLDVAAQEHAGTGKGLLVSYELDLNVESVVETILPYLGFGEEVHADPQGVRVLVADILSTRSNTSGASRGQDTQWTGESIPVSEEVAAASRAFMGGDMESIARMREADRL